MLTKEQIREKRKALYQQAKAKRDADPHYQALKENAKLERRKKYREYADQQKQEKLDEKLKKRAQKDALLMEMIKPASSLDDTQPVHLYLVK